MTETKSNTASEITQRQSFILNVLLLGTFVLVAITLALVTLTFMLRGPSFQGAPPLAIAAIGAVILGLYGMSKRGYAKVVAWLFVVGLGALGAVIMLAWGIALPVAPLVFVLVIVVAGILLGTGWSLVVTGLVSVMVLFFGLAQSLRIIHPDLSWMERPVGMADASAYIFIWSIIALVASLSNHELERSLVRARASEAALAQERDLLEERVEERTRELKQAQLEKILQLNRFADFGRISSGFFHDIINPLTAVSLNLEQLSTKRRSELLKEAIKGLKDIEDFAQAARKQVQGREGDLSVFSPSKEIHQVVEVLESKARGARVSIKCEVDKSARLYGSAIKFHQLISNLVANAIDAYDGMPAAHRIVAVSDSLKGQTYVLKVRDYGVGIPADHLERIFDPFFTTKSVDKGTGIGLLIVKQVAEEDFAGRIEVHSHPSAGTIFTVSLPAVIMEKLPT